MGYKDDIDAIKTELLGDGALLEYFVRFERFYKKYKLVVVAVVAGLIAWFLYAQIASYQDAKHIESSTIAFNSLSKDPKSQDLRNKLKKENEKLYRLFMLKESLEQNDTKALTDLLGNNDFVSKLAQYHIAMFEKNPSKLSSYASQENAILGDFAILSAAYEYLIKKDKKAFKEELKRLSFDSAFAENAKILEHFGDLK